MKKIYILALTFFALFCGQVSYGQGFKLEDYNDFLKAFGLPNFEDIKAGGSAWYIPLEEVVVSSEPRPVPIDWDYSGNTTDYNNNTDPFNQANTPNTSNTNTPCPTPTCPPGSRVDGCDCVANTWYYDGDGDGWHSKTYDAAISPGGKWSSSTKGQDCDDTKASVDNICKPIDPCGEIKKELADPKFKETLEKLDNPTTLHLPNETGFWRDTDGNFTPMKLEGNRTCLLPDDKSKLVSCDHVHQEPWTVVKSDGSIEYEANYIMPSRQDIWNVYFLMVNAQYYHLPLNDIYSGTTNSIGNYQIRFSGNPDSLSYASINRDNMGNESFDCDYIEALRKYGDNETGLLYFINTIMGKTDIEVYKVEATGAIKLTLGQNNTVTKTPCVP